MKMLELISEKAIVPDLESTERNGVIRELVAALAASGAIPADRVDSIVKSILTRERTRGTTGFGKGVAAPHAKVDDLKAPVAAVGRSGSGIDFASLDGAPVFGVVLLLSPSDDAERHLRAMDVIFGHLQNERFRKFLRQSDSVGKIHDLLREVDENTLVS